MGVQPDQGAYDGPSPASSNTKRKRKREQTTDNAALRHEENDDGDVDGDNDMASVGLVNNIKKKAKKGKNPGTADPPAEKRLRRSVLLLYFVILRRDRIPQFIRISWSSLLTWTSPPRFRPKAPSSFQAVYERATTQRFFLLSRSRRDTPDCPEEVFELTGSTGNIYHVHIQKQPICDCPHGRASNQCKHIVWCLKTILRAPEAHVYQLALLSSELRDIFANAPAPVDESGANPEKDKNRKEIDGDCPICFEEMRAGDAEEPLVWCKAACGQNIVCPPNSVNQPRA